MKKLSTCFLLATILFAATSIDAQSPLVHDTEYHILEAQNGEKWTADDQSIDAKLAEFRKKNDGKSPNFINILIDDIGFGDLGIPELVYLSDEQIQLLAHMSAFSITGGNTANLLADVKARADDLISCKI